LREELAIIQGLESKGEVLKLKAEDVSRFKILHSYLSNGTFNISETPFSGWNKFEKKSFNYGMYHIEPPEYLNAIGHNWHIINSPICIAFGGTLSPTSDGFQLTELLAQQSVLGHGAIVIAGSAFGVDTAAHLGALDSNGKTIAVLANPVSYGLYPYTPKRTFLEEGILQNGGLLVSEYDSPTEDCFERLLQRDRITTALSDIFVAVECSHDSATVDSAKRAKLQGKKVVVIDWTKIRHTYHKPKISGATQLIQENVADAIPKIRVSNIEDPRFMHAFHELIAGIGTRILEGEQWKSL